MGNSRSHRRKSANKTSKYRGVFWEKERAKWRAQIQYTEEGRPVLWNLGRFETEEEAAKEYNAAAAECGFFPEALNKIPA